MSLRNKVLWLSTFLLLVIVIEGAVLISSNRTVLQQADQIDSIEVPILNNAHKLKLAVIQVQQWLTDISATRGLDGLDDGFDEAKNNAERFSQYISELKRLDSANLNQYQQMEKAFSEYYQAGKQMAQAYIDNGPAAGNLTMAQFDQAAATLNNQIDPFLQQAQQRVSAAVKSQTSSTRSAGTSILLGSLIVIVCLVFMSYTISRAITKLPKIVANMVSGDLSKDFHIEGNDEISQIMRSLQLMRDQVKDLVNQIASSTDELSETAKEVETLSHDNRVNIQRQFSETEQVATAMNEMTMTAQDVAHTISLTSKAAEEANNEASSGQVIVADAIEQINKLAAEIEQASSTIYQLEKDSESITGILDVIKGIAEQTNLLALNAAIEAARAGEQGRGFAVVADEVRSLASRTQQSTEEIHQMLDQLLSGSRQAVSAMKSSKEQADSAVEKASNTGASLSNISMSIANIYDMSSQIATAAEQQGAVAEEINQNVVRINDMSNESIANAEHSNNVSQSMAKLSFDLKKTVDRFIV